MKFLEWVVNFNESEQDKWVLTEDDIRVLIEQYSGMVRNLYVDKVNALDKTNDPLRPSMLGKPALLIAYNYFNPENNGCLPSRIGRLTSIGYYFEQWLTAQLLGMGEYEIEFGVESRVKFSGRTIKCHPDMVLTDLGTGQKIIIECKEVSDWYYKQWAKYGMINDDRGYLTQASIYSYALDLPIVWVMGNRTTGEINLIALTNEDRNKYIERAATIIEVLSNVNCWDDCFQYFCPPTPNRTKKGLTYPFSVKPIAELIYELDHNGYVLDYRYPEKYAHLKPELNV